MLELAFFDFINEFINDMGLALKIMGLLILVGFVRVRLGFGKLSTFVLLAFAYYALFQNWVFFAPLVIGYLILMSGLERFLGMDMMFVASEFSRNLGKDPGMIMQDKQMLEQAGVKKKGGLFGWLGVK